MDTKELTLDGVRYLIVREQSYLHNKKTRTSIFLRRPNGKEQYFVVRYENGSYSTPVTIG